MTSRVVLAQTEGVLAQSGDLQMEDACAALRPCARDDDLRLSDLADAVVWQRVPGQLLLDHARAEGASQR